MSKDIKKFKDLGEYSYPGWPVRKYAKRFYSRLLQIFQSDDDQAFISDDKLSRTDQELISKIVTLPAYGSLMDELNETLKEWLQKDTFRNTLVVLPPGDENLIATWALDNDAFLLPEPGRAHLISETSEYNFEIPSDKGIVVIPRLERWFLRHHNGLAIVQDLLEKIQNSQVKCLIGCNSWAHQFLQKATNSQFVLPNGVMFQAYDGDRLSDWFSKMVTVSGCKNLQFKSIQSGRDVFSKNKDDEFKDNFLRQLAAESLGIPWIAWELWRKSLNSENKEDKDNNGANDDQTTLWLAALDEFSLPNTSDEGALLVLHALLLHTQLSYQELMHVLPVIEHSNVVFSLINSGFVVHTETKDLTCNVAAYPSIRNSLASAGFPMDKL